MNLAKTLPLLMASAASALLLVGCAGSSGTAATTPIPAAAEPAHWSYAGDSGPTGWGDLDAGFSSCATGTQQSPIDIPSSTSLAGPLLTLDSERSEGDVEDTGHTVQVGADNGTSRVEYDGTSYELAQMHVHTPSEHTVDGVAAAAEFHFVHQSETGDRLVVGVLAVEGAESSAYDAFAENAAATVGTNADPEIDLDVAAMLPATLDHYAYEGSLTTPPCSEGVQWIVLSTPIELSAQQLDEVDEAHPGNTRPAQPLGERSITRGTGSVVAND